LEGEGFVKKLFLLRRNKTKMIVYSLLKVLSIGLIIIVCKWWKELSVKLQFDMVDDVKTATHILIKEYNDSYQIVEKQQDLSFYYYLLKYSHNSQTGQYSVRKYAHPPISQIHALYFGSKSGFINDQQASSLRQLYGKCQLSIPMVRL